MALSDLETLINASAQNVAQFKGLTAAYQILLGGVPTLDGYDYLINTNNSTNFGAGPGVVFNEENIYINTVNSLYQGNPAAAAAFDAILVGAASIQDKLNAVYNFVVPVAFRSEEGRAYFLSQADFYVARAAELDIDGPNGFAVVAFAGLTNIAVRSDIPGLGDSINDLLAAVNDGSAAIPQGGSALTPIETADGASFDGDDAVVGAGQTFTLTEGSDTLQGQPGNLIGSKGTVDNSGDDIIVAGTSSSGGPADNNLGSGDLIDGGQGFDTLNITDSAGSNMVPTMTGVERINFQSLNSGNLNLVNTTGVQQIWNFRSTDVVNVENVQEDAVIGAFDTDTNTEVEFDAGAITDGALDFVVSEYGRGGATGAFAITVADTVDTANLVVQTNSNIEINVAGSAVANLNIEGAGDLVMDTDNGFLQGLTSVEASGLTGELVFETANNNNDVTFVGGSGNTTLELGGGDNDITTGAGDDVVTVGASGLMGDNTISTGAGDDVVDVSSAAGDQTVDLGADDDRIVLDDTLTDADSLEGGAGNDTLSVDVVNAAAATANGDVDAGVNGFEALELTGTVGEAQALTVDLDNLDDIDDVTILADLDTGTAVAESQYLDFQSNSSAFPTSITIEGVEIEIAPGLDSFQIADYIAANFSAQIIAAYNANNPGEVMTSVTSLTGSPFFDDQIQFTFARASGDVPQVSVVANTDPLSAGAGFGATTTTTAGTDPVDEVQTLSINTAPTTNGVVTINFDNDVDANVPVVVNLIGGETTVETAARINTAINSAGLTGVSASVVGSVITLTYDAVALAANANVDAVSFTDTGTTGAAATVGTTTAGVPFVLEQQTVVVTNGTDSDGGYIRISLVGSGSIDVEVPANLTIDQLGVFITGQLSAIQANIPEIAAIGYNTTNNTLTIDYTAEAGNVNAISFANTPGNTADVFDFQGDIVGGVDGSLGGVLTLDNMATGGTVTLAGNTGDAVTGGEIIVNLTADTAADMLNVKLATGYAGDGQVTLDGVETVMLSNTTGVALNLNLESSDAEAITVTGTGGVSFLQAFGGLVSVNASGLTVATSAAGVDIESTNAAGTTFTGSAGEDRFVGGAGGDTMTGGTGDDLLIGNAGVDTIGGGAGNDIIDGGLAGDTLTGGAGDDTFVYDGVADSQGVTVDTITDFTSGDDTLDFTAFGFGDLAYSGEANGYGAVLTSLVGAGAGNAQAVLDLSTNTLYIDIDGNAVLNDQDMAIDLTGVTSLQQSDFAF